MVDNNFNFIDTDIFIHRLDFDSALSGAATQIFDQSHPSAMSSFSLLELKGNYISDLVLLQRKIIESDSFTNAFAKIRRVGGRKFELMFAMLINWISNFSPHPWVEARRQLLTDLDGQIGMMWEYFKNSVDQVFDDIKCSRAHEEPEDDGTRWITTIPHCNESNTKCVILEFMRLYNHELQNLVDCLDALDHSLMTEELRKIREVVKRTIIDDRFPWEGRTCRQVADLIIGLQSKSGEKLISSNKKEHGQLHIPLGYTFEHFNMVEKRSK